MEKYQILEEKKENVYLVLDLKENKKILKKYKKSQHIESTRYLHEIKALENIKHPNIVSIEKAEEDEENYYLIYAYKDGNSLEYSSNNCKFFKSLIKILEALNYLHQKNRVHGDIKPSNILISNSGEPYILDFGTSIIANSMTQTLHELSLIYASPSQKSNQKLDYSSDLYSFGITLIELFSDKYEFDFFVSGKKSVEELIYATNKFDSGVNEYIKRILFRLVSQEEKEKYRNAEDVANEFKHLVKFFDCKKKYKIDLHETIKQQISEDFKISQWNVEDFLEDKFNKEIIYIKYGKNREDREEIQIAINDLILFCGIEDEEKLFAFRFSRRVPENIKKEGQIFEDSFKLTDARDCEKTYFLIDDLERKSKEIEKKKTEIKESQDFLTKSNKHLETERKVLESKNIYLHGLKINDNKAKKILAITVIPTNNITFTEEHLKDIKKKRQFVEKIFEDGLIEDNNISDPICVLNELVENYFFETKQFITVDLLSKLYSKERSVVQSFHIDRYKGKNKLIEKKSFHSKILFELYREYLKEVKENEKVFEQDDNVIITGLEKDDKFKEIFTIKKIDKVKNRIELGYSKFIKYIPDEVKIDFDYDQKNKVLRKQEFAIKDLKNNNTIIENLLGKIANPKTLAPKREIPSLDYYHNKELDENQKEAVDKVLSLDRGEYLVMQGPPGTGKTTVITEIIKQILEKDPIAKILVSSQSNQAVDNVLEKIVEEENKIVRFGNDKEKLSEIAKRFHEDLVFENLKSETLKRVKEDDNNYFLQSEELFSLHEEWKNKIATLDDEIKTILFKKIRVVFGTLVGISSWNDFRGIEFDYVIIDEAGKALLPELLIPLRRAKKFVLVGDHKQLPPFLDDKIIGKIDDVERKDLEYTFFEELFKKIEYKDFKHRLKFNYRADKNIANIYSEVFYDSEIETKDFVSREHGLAYDKKVYWYNTSKLENRFEESFGTGRRNKLNSDKVIELLRDINLKAKETKIEKTVGVITPYIAQKDLINSKLKKIQEEFENITIEVNTVDSFQGSDRDIIIYDVVRSLNSKEISNIDFVADEKRLNVSLSRAKELLFILGDADFIYQSKVKDGKNSFKQIIEMMSRNSQSYEIKELL